MIEVGDWVHSYSAGIWQVYRIVEEHYETRASLSDEKILRANKMVFSSRVCNNKWKKSFTNECFSQAHISKLAEDELARLEEFLSQNKMLSKFQKYKPKPINYCTERGFMLPEEYSYEKFLKTCEELLIPLFNKGVEFDDVLLAIQNSELSEFQENKHCTNARLMFFSPDFLVREKELIFNRYEALNF